MNWHVREDPCLKQFNVVVIRPRVRVALFPLLLNEGAPGLQGFVSSRIDIITHLNYHITADI